MNTDHSQGKPGLGTARESLGEIPLRLDLASDPLFGVRRLSYEGDDLPEQHIPKLEDVRFEPGPMVKRPGYRSTLRERCADWFLQGRVPPGFQRELDALFKIRYQQVIYEHEKRIATLEVENENLRKDLSGIAALCNGLADDLNSTLGELRSQQAEQSERPRVRIARNFAAFSEAATIAARKGATK